MTCAAPRSLTLLVLSVAASLLGCGSRTALLADTGGAGKSEAGLALADGAPGDGALADGLIPRLDAAVRTDATSCTCPPGEVWRRSPCTPTDQLGCGSSCTPGLSGSCSAGYRCDSCGASPACSASSCRPACVLEPAQAVRGGLRLLDTSGPAGDTMIGVQGTNWYVGALFYKVRMAGQELMQDISAMACTVKAIFKNVPPGVHAVEVSQYGGKEPWVLAGFYTALSGVTPGPTVQPGFPCSTGGAPCAAAKPYVCTCMRDGRCGCEK